MSKKLIFKNLSLVVLLGTLFFLNGCKDDDTQPEEVITTVKITFSQPGGVSQTFSWKDLDGAGGNNPTIEAIKLKQGSYQTKVEFLNESESPVEDVTEEIREESNEHLVVYSPSDNTVFIISDKDKQGKNLGLETLCSTGAVGGGKTLTIKLLHQPNKDNLSNPGGDVDVEVVFPLEIQ